MAMEAKTYRFADTVRTLGRACRQLALGVPVFRSPPGLLGVQRSIRRNGESVVVSVAVRERPWGAVVADMVEGVIVTNDLSGSRADIARSALWRAVDEEKLAA